MNYRAIQMLTDIRNEYENGSTNIVISGCIGPRGDGYQPDSMMTIEEAEAYHLWQMKVLANTEADMVTALTMTYAEEAIGIVRAAQSVGLPVVISFTVETDGRLPNGQSLKDAVQQVDKATWNGPIYYMVNCAHPTHFDSVLDTDEAWVQRIHGLRSNASRKSHAELNESDTLDDGNPVEFGQQYRALKDRLSNLNVLGGCCGTDHRHIEAVCKAVTPLLSEA